MSLSSRCGGCLPPDMACLVPDHYDVIGDVAVVSLPDALLPYREVIGRCVAEERHSIRSVCMRTAPVAGTRRTAGYAVIYGRESTETVHREYGFTYCLDVKTAFYNPRLAFERHRVAGCVRAGERVLVPFAGVGPFVVPAAQQGARVTAIEMNPDACGYLRENVRTNGVQDAVTIFEGDAMQLLLSCREAYDRAIVPTPYGLNTALDEVIPLVRRGGIIHFYTFTVPEETDMLMAKFRGMGCVVSGMRRCGNVAPGVSRWVFDLRRR
ncbi:class I SAM-dependent methyltransferase family protein [Methanogenium sp. S4BF]|uniref:class I SAM-dependent methyltransferase n=1 Tax=Methanogenium sp. S4BF TaxID=1789226 RepID=UPI0024171282|nr:class I SAM-dependent methyltransferase family protein [Methanogenium sp. S4BF]WFN33972.1 class I SAM-dependent methyltransferase family protein [Methanogenium sp. S4BF]